MELYEGDDEMSINNIDKNNLCLWISMIGLETGAIQIDEFIRYLEAEVEKVNHSEVILELYFNTSKGIKRLSRLLHEHLNMCDILMNEEYQYLVEGIIVGILKYKHDNNIIDSYGFGLMSHKLSLYYHPEPPLLYGNEFIDELHIFPHEQEKITKEIKTFAKYVDWCKIGLDKE